MAVPSTGPLSMSDIAAEFAGNVPYDLSDYYSASAGIPDSGEISIGDFYGASGASPIQATGGSVYDSGGFRYHKFTSNGTLSVTALASGSFSNTINYLVCGGGAGGGGHYGNCAGGGGGGGGSVSSSVSASIAAHTVAIGPLGYGSSKQGGSGGNSSVFGVTAVGGGGGGNYGTYNKGDNGGCGGGGPGGNRSGGTGSQGGNGGSGDAYLDAGGGGGAMEAGRTVTPGRGRTWFDGTSYGAGGSGGRKSGGAGGSAGGTGNGGIGNGHDYTASGTKAGNGSAGVVVVRYQIT